MTPWRPLSIEWFLRSFAVVAYLLLLLVVYNNWRVEAHPYSLLFLLVTEAYTLLLVLSARRAERRDVTPMPVVGTVYTSGYFLLLEVGGTLPLLADGAAATLQAIGLAMAVVSKVALGRAFGVLPAVRGLVTWGPYRVVRHPIYLGYLIGDLGFLLAHASARNAAVIGTLLMVQVMRIEREEAVFRGSGCEAAWNAYRDRVRYRLVPHVY